jgi:hypothetical protein
VPNWRPAKNFRPTQAPPAPPPELAPVEVLGAAAEEVSLELECTDEHADRPAMAAAPTDPVRK